MIVLEVVFLAAFWAWAFSAVLFLRNTVLPRLAVTRTPELFSLPAHTVHFRATDGISLEGWTIAADPSRPWIIMCHGLGSNRSDLLDIAAGLHRARFNLFLFDFRGHGGSQGRTTSFGWQEQRDLEGALAFLGEQPEVAARPYGIYGISMGGSVALMVAARDERLGAIAADSPYTNLEESIGHHLALLYPAVPRIPFLGFILWTYRLRFGVWPGSLSPERCAAQLTSRPLLLIHGAADPRMPLEGAKRVFDRASQPKEFMVVSGAGHLESFGLDPDVYVKRLTDFFEGGF